MQDDNGQELNVEVLKGTTREMGVTRPQGQVAMPGMVNLRPGMSIAGKYEVLELLGKGGMGAVYRCLDVISDIEVAIKTIPPELCQSKAEMEDLKDNYQLVSKLIHKNIAAYRALVQEPSMQAYFIVMELVDGIDLKTWMNKKRQAGELTLKAVVAVLRQVAEALDYAHEQRIMHRDIKPGNIMVTPDGMVKVLDFGLAANIHSSMSYISGEFNEQSGTCLYMAPEQWQGLHQDAATDQYALAVIAYEMLAGKRPFENDDIKLLFEMVLKEDPAPISGLPQNVNEALARGLAKERRERYASCMDFVTALAGPKMSQQGGMGASNRGGMLGGLLMLFFAILALVFWWYSRRQTGGGSLSVSPHPHVRETERVADVGTNPETLLAKADETVGRIHSATGNMSMAGDAGTPVKPAKNVDGAASQSSSATLVGADVSPEAVSVMMSGDKAYLVVDLKAGTWRYSKEPPDVKDERCRSSELWLRHIPKGSFKMGDEKLKRSVTLTQDFYIGVFEVTQAQWKQVTGMEAPSTFTGDALPVEGVSYKDIMERFLTQLKVKTELVFYLPTEAQWEYACRAGKAENNCHNLDEKAWYRKNAENRTHDVGTKKPSDWGLYDMYGNVSEKCSDWYMIILEEGTYENPTGPQRGRDEMRVVRGMDYTGMGKDNAETLKRGGCRPEEAGENAGFRLVLLL